MFSPTSILAVMCKQFTILVPSGRFRLKGRVLVKCSKLGEEKGLILSLT
jgi:hypothetical protein